MPSKSQRRQQCPEPGQELPRRGDRILLLTRGWLDEILLRGKSLEVRGAPLACGWTWLGCKGFVIALAKLSDSCRVASLEEFKSLKEFHHVDADELPYKKTWVTLVSDVQALADPIKFQTKSGPITWNKFEPAVVANGAGAKVSLQKVKKTVSKKMTANVRSVIAEAAVAASVPISVLENPSLFTIGSACSGWCSELHACRRLGLPFIPVFGCDISPHCKALCEETWGHSLWYDDCEGDAFLNSPYVDVFLAGFPCQPFSKAGLCEGEQDRKGRGQIFWSLALWIQTHVPRVFILENVKNLLDSHYEFLLDVMETLQKIQWNGQAAYHVSWKVLNARDCGTPQNRERVLICGIRAGPGARPMIWPKKVAMEDIYAYIDPATEGEAGFPGRLPSSESERRNLLLVLDQLKSQGKDPLRSPIVVDIGGSKPHYNEGYSPCLTHCRAGSGGHWLTWKQRKMTTCELLKIMDVPPADVKWSSVSPRQLGLMAGNAIPVKMLSMVLSQALKCANLQ